MESDNKKRTWVAIVCMRLRRGLIQTKFKIISWEQKYARQIV